MTRLGRPLVALLAVGALVAPVPTVPAPAPPEVAPAAPAPPEVAEVPACTRHYESRGNYAAVARAGHRAAALRAVTGAGRPVHDV
ncbi:MAG: hypothetical protein ACRD0D_01525 [Acidimicrobiales bacterium]